MIGCQIEIFFIGMQKIKFHKKKQTIHSLLNAEKIVAYFFIFEELNVLLNSKKLCEIFQISIC